MRNPALTDQIAVPFVDLGRLNEPIRAEFLEAVAGLVDSGAFVNGPAVGSFERAFASYCGTGEAVGVASGLDALRLALLAGGIQPGDEVIVPAQTFVATLEAVTQAGGTPVPADIGPLDYNLDPAAAEAAVTSRTRFLLPVHLYGQMADMQSLRSVADRAGLAIVEDACQAHGAERDGLRAGGGGLAGAFSFYPAKNLGAMGDAGALTTDDENLAEAVRALREHGQRRKYHHDLEGYTARLDTIQAIVLELKLRLLDGWNEERRAAAQRSRRGARGRRRPRPAGRRRREQSGLASLRRPDGRPRVAGGFPAGARDRDGPPLSRARAPRTGLRAPRLRGRDVPDRGAGGARRDLAAAVPRHQRVPAHGRLGCRQGVLQPWRLSPRTTLPAGS